MSTPVKLTPASADVTRPPFVPAAKPRFAATHNFARLALFMLRRDRLWLPLWTLGCLVFATFFVPLLPDMAGSEQDIAILRETMSNPAMLAMCGIIYGDSYSFGVMYSQFMLVFSALLVAAMNILFVLRHTRKDEAEGRLEMLVALSLGRSANLLAVALLSLAFNLVIALLSGATIAAFGVEGMNIAGSFTFGVAIAVCGLVFAGLTALVAQLTASPRTAMGIAFALLGGMYLLRGAGDVSGDVELLALVSPFGLIERCYLFVDNRVWPLLLLLAAALVLFALAFALNARRDSGAGLIAPRSGRVQASALLSGPWSLAWRLTRGTVVAWLGIVLASALAFGSVFGDMSAFYESNELYGLMIGTTVTTTNDLLEPVISMFMLIMAVLSAVPVALVVFRLWGEEKRGRLEQFYGGAVSRLRTLAGYALIAMLLACLLQLATALGMWSAAQVSMDDPVAFALLLKAALNYLPALLFVAGLAVFIVGLLPRASALVWLLLVYTFFVAYMGTMLNLPAWALRLTPFAALPRYPIEDFDPIAAFLLCAAALALTAFGLAAYRARDMD